MDALPGETFINWGFRLVDWVFRKVGLQPVTLPPVAQSDLSTPVEPTRKVPQKP